MLFQTIALVTIAAIVSSHPLSNAINQADPPDLSYLGNRLFGTPSPNSKIQTWSETHEQNPEELGEYAEGDILFPQSKSRNGLVAQAARWPNGIVPYEISALYPSNDLQMINKAIDIYHKYTCIKFRPKTSRDKDYISIVSGASGCWSSVGRTEGRQEVNLQSPYCTTKVGTPLHELMHAVGFLHEQNRWERDDFVSIAWANIQAGHDQNFKKADKGTTDGFGVGYDYRSVMHYSPKAFSANGQATIIPKDQTKNLKMGQRDGFSRGDIIKINAMYGCPEKSPGAPTTSGGGDNEIIPAGGAPSGSNNNNGGGILGFLFQIISS